MKLERGIPPPVPDDANERVHRVDAEAEAWRTANAALVRNLLTVAVSYPDKPVGWDEAAVRQHWPELWTLWNQYRQARQRLLAHAENEKQRRLILDPGPK